MGAKLSRVFAALAGVLILSACQQSVVDWRGADVYSRVVGACAELSINLAVADEPGPVNQTRVSDVVPEQVEAGPDVDPFVYRVTGTTTVDSDRRHHYDWTCDLTVSVAEAALRAVMSRFEER